MKSNWRLPSLLIVVVFLPGVLFAQPFVREVEGIPVTISGQLVSLPWAGGINAPNVQFIDVDADGDFDLFVYDYDNGGVNFYRNEGTRFVPNFKLRPHDILLPSFSIWFCLPIWIQMAGSIS